MPFHTPYAAALKAYAPTYTRNKYKPHHCAHEHTRTYLLVETSMGKGADVMKIPDKLTDSERKQKKNNNKAKANPDLAAEKLKKNSACRDRRAASGSTKAFK